MTFRNFLSREGLSEFTFLIFDTIRLATGRKKDSVAFLYIASFSLTHNIFGEIFRSFLNNKHRKALAKQIWVFRWNLWPRMHQWPVSGSTYRDQHVVVMQSLWVTWHCRLSAGSWFGEKHSAAYCKLLYSSQLCFVHFICHVISRHIILHIVLHDISY